MNTNEVALKFVIVDEPKTKPRTVYQSVNKTDKVKIGTDPLVPIRIQEPGVGITHGSIAMDVDGTIILRSFFHPCPTLIQRGNASPERASRREALENGDIIHIGKATIAVIFVEDAAQAADDPDGMRALKAEVDANGPVESAEIALVPPTDLAPTQEVPKQTLADLVRESFPTTDMSSQPQRATSLADNDKTPPDGIHLPGMSGLGSNAKAVLITSGLATAGNTLVDGGLPEPIQIPPFDLTPTRPAAGQKHEVSSTQEVLEDLSAKPRYKTTIMGKEPLTVAAPFEPRPMTVEEAAAGPMPMHLHEPGTTVAREGTVVAASEEPAPAAEKVVIVVEEEPPLPATALPPPIQLPAPGTLLKHNAPIDASAFSLTEPIGLSGRTPLITKAEALDVVPAPSAQAPVVPKPSRITQVNPFKSAAQVHRPVSVPAASSDAAATVANVGNLRPRAITPPSAPAVSKPMDTWVPPSVPAAPIVSRSAPTIQSAQVPSNNGHGFRWIVILIAAALGAGGVNWWINRDPPRCSHVENRAATPEDTGLWNLKPGWKEYRLKNPRKPEDAYDSYDICEAEKRGLATWVPKVQK
ncbi:hypothetical protein EXS71_04305 [Candidatus Uhrbacteria bacterium]|nr:hypothetical protein [Candidatus Uhrbacteria bacterium]